MTAQIQCGYQTDPYDPSQRVIPDRASVYALPARRDEGIVYLDGPWVSKEACLFRPLDATGASSIVVTYHGGNVHAFMGPGVGGASEVTVLRDSYPVAEHARGMDLMVPGRFTIVEVNEARLYSLIRDPKEDSHELRLETRSPGLRVYSLSFEEHAHRA